jgi:hypothetical protein
MPGALSSNGNPTIAICGGPRKSVQVNSDNPAAVSANSNTTVDLSKAGPNDPGNCTTGTGADFGSWGGPPTATFTFLGGSKGKFIQPASWIADPLALVPAPLLPGAPLAKTPLAFGSGGCPPATPGLKPCQLYSPGYYPTGIDVKNETAVFAPGIYYTNGGFGNGANGEMYMATGQPSHAITGQGMIVYNTGGGGFNVGANAAANLLGSPLESIYKGILFFQDRNAPATTHRLGGGGALTLVGTVYITNTRGGMLANAAQFQTLLLQGTPGSSTKVIGEIITSALQLGGNAGITMQLNPGATLHVRQVALVR